jgi:hypothetical protein
MLQSSKLLFGTQKESLHPINCTTKMLQNSKLLFGTQKLAPTNWKCFKAPNPTFKMRQDRRKKRRHHQNTTIKTQNTVLIIMKKRAQRRRRKIKKCNKNQTTSKNSKEKNVKSILLHKLSFLKIVELGFLSS